MKGFLFSGTAMQSLHGICVSMCALLITAHALPTTTQTPTTYPTTMYRETTTTGTQIPGCMINGIYYPVGSHQVGDDRSSNWCYGYYCNPNGEYYNWDNFNCHPTTTPPTTVPAFPPTDPPKGCVYQGRFYLDNTVIQESLDHKGSPCVIIFCDSKGNLVHKDNNCALVG